MVQPVGLSDRPEHAAVFGDAMNGWLEGRGLSDTPAPLLQRQPSRSDGRPPAGPSDRAQFPRRSGQEWTVRPAAAASAVGVVLARHDRQHVFVTCWAESWVAR
jgi:hypothetical protein